MSLTAVNGKRKVDHYGGFLLFVYHFVCLRVFVNDVFITLFVQISHSPCYYVFINSTIHYLNELCRSLGLSFYVVQIM